MTNSAVHDLDVVAWLLGSPSSRSLARAASVPRPADFADPQLILLRTADGVLSTVDIFLNARYGYDVRCEVVGESGTASLREPARTGSTARWPAACVRRRLAPALRRGLPPRAAGLGRQPRRRRRRAARQRVRRAGRERRGRRGDHLHARRRHLDPCRGARRRRHRVSRPGTTNAEVLLTRAPRMTRPGAGHGEKCPVDISRSVRAVTSRLAWPRLDLVEDGPGVSIGRKVLVAGGSALLKKRPLVLGAVALVLALACWPPCS